MEIQTHHLYPPPSNVVIGGLCGSQDFVIDHNHFSFNFQHNNHQYHHQQQQNVSIVDHCFGFNSNAYNINHSPIPNSHHNLALIFQNEKNKLDHIIKSQSGILRMILQEQTKQQATTLLKRVEPNALYMLNQKDKQIEKAMKEMVDLEAFVTRLEAENQLWKRAAQDKEAMIMHLNQSLENVKERYNFFHNNEVVGVIMEDEESCNDQNWGMRMENKLRSEEDKQQCSRKMNMVCKNCDFGRSCIMFLPCRHVCSCKVCEPLLQSCPICTMPKKNTIEIRDFDLSY
ncbi:PREDICTED: probable BOI-related E3 ubiquitin-protein ligase 2 [Lupinus angustifolius]|uniref:probable BOI-related E3 ubiquitin-protein ligase 2 n=1 Tax=Lupinus angustifolius TaxID=3871 RepID=UPI00092E335A|nr:PREDICTED: probable BOI-related E3 ubiquitin-protein ligase 2 [Lupinus angustifolius]